MGGGASRRGVLKEVLGWQRGRERERACVSIYIYIYIYIYVYIESSLSG